MNNTEKNATMMNRDNKVDSEMTHLEEGDRSDLLGESSREGTSREFTDESQHQKIRIANRETQWLFCARIILVMVLILVASAICGSVFWFASKTEHENFKLTYYELAYKVVDAFQANAARRLGAIESLAVTISSEAKALGQTWPNVTVPDYEHRMSYALDLAEVISIIFIPIVTKETRKGWEEYSVQNQGWYKEGLELQDEANLVSLATAEAEQYSIDILEKTWGSSPDGTVPEEIFRVNGTGAEPETSDGPYAPWWQFAPVFPVPNLVNYNTLSHPSRNPSITAMLESQEILVSAAWDYADTSNPTTVGKYAALNLFLNRREDIMLHYQDGPVSDVYVPIFESKADKKVVGFMTAYIYWQVYFHKILPKATKKLHVILENSCSQQFTYSIEGEEATYLGQGHLHEPRFDDMEVTTGWNAFLSGDGDPSLYTEGGQCIYKVNVYPSRELEDQFKGNTPMYFAITLACTFIFTSLAFVVYDKAVERRNAIVMKQAVQSTEVVNTLYPAAVRERMFGGLAEQNPAVGKRLSMGEENGESKGGRDDIIAEHYSKTSVLFADLAGFTAWSDKREPKDVFLLLETLYGAFDAIAKRRHVFKVETIGDCYLAAAGVPNPDGKHALTIVRFAQDIMSRMNILVQAQLANSLGEDTLKLQLRVGIHSGSVTAGVLRGDRARFQLFGDTVNTASRMESNGLPGKIQVSEATANLLIAAGKGEWVSEREGGIEAKGKGYLKTFWVQTKTKSMSRSPSMTDMSSEDYTCSDPSSTMDKSTNHTIMSRDSTQKSRGEREHNTSEDKTVKEGKKPVGGNDDDSEHMGSSSHRRVSSFADEDVEKPSSEVGNTSGTEDSFFDDADLEELYFV